MVGELIPCPGDMHQLLGIEEERPCVMVDQSGSNVVNFQMFTECVDVVETASETDNVPVTDDDLATDVVPTRLSNCGASKLTDTAGTCQYDEDVNMQSISEINHGSSELMVAGVADCQTDCETHENCDVSGDGVKVLPSSEVHLSDSTDGDSLVIQRPQVTPDDAAVSDDGTASCCLATVAAADRAAHCCVAESTIKACLQSHVTHTASSETSDVMECDAHEALTSPLMYSDADSAPATSDQRDDPQQCTHGPSHVVMTTPQDDVMSVNSYGSDNPEGQSTADVAAELCDDEAVIGRYSVTQRTADDTEHLDSSGSRGEHRPDDIAADDVSVVTNRDIARPDCSDEESDMFRNRHKSFDIKKNAECGDEEFNDGMQSDDMEDAGRPDSDGDCNNNSLLCADDSLSGSNNDALRHCQLMRGTPACELSARHLLVTEDFQPITCIGHVPAEFIISQQSYSQRLISQPSDFASSQKPPGVLEPESRASTKNSHLADCIVSPTSPGCHDMSRDRHTCLEATTSTSVDEQREAGWVVDWFDNSKYVKPASQADKDVERPTGMDVLASVCESLVSVVGVECGVLDRVSGACDFDADTGRTENFVVDRSSSSVKSNDTNTSIDSQETGANISKVGGFTEAEGVKSCEVEELGQCASQTYSGHDDAKSCHGVTVAELDDNVDDLTTNNRRSTYSAAAADDDESEYETSFEESSAGPCEITLDSESDNSSVSHTSSESSDADDDVTSESEGTQRSDDVVVFDDAREFHRTTQPGNQYEARSISYEDISEISSESPYDETIEPQTQEICHETFASVPDEVDDTEQFKLAEESPSECVPQTAGQSKLHTSRKLIKLAVSEGCSNEIWWNDVLPQVCLLGEYTCQLPVSCEVENDDDHTTTTTDDNDDDFQDTETKYGELMNRSEDEDSTLEPATGMERADDVPRHSFSRQVDNVARRWRGTESEKDVHVPSQQAGHVLTFGIEDDAARDDSSMAAADDELFYTDCEDTHVRDGLVERDTSLVPADVESSSSHRDVDEQSQRDVDYKEQLEGPEVKCIDVETTVEPDVGCSRAVPEAGDTSTTDNDKAAAAAVSDIYVAVPVTMNAGGVLAAIADVNNTLSSSRPTADDVRRCQHSLTLTDSSCDRLLPASQLDLPMFSPVSTTSDGRAWSSLSMDMEQSTRLDSEQVLFVDDVFHRTSTVRSGGLPPSSGKPDHGNVDAESPRYSCVSRDQGVLSDVISKSENLLSAEPCYHSNHSNDEPAAVAATSVASSNVDASVAHSNASRMDYCQADDAERRSEAMTLRTMTSDGAQVVAEDVGDISPDEALYADDQCTPSTSSRVTPLTEVSWLSLIHI